MRWLALMLALAGGLHGADALAQAPPAKPSNPSDLPIAESVRVGGDTIGLSTCFAKGDIITCKFVLTRNAAGNADYIYDPKTWFGGSKVIDNFKGEHQIIDGYLVDGRNRHVKKLNLETGESLVFSQDYGGEKTDGVDTLRVMFPGIGGRTPPFVLHGGLESAQ